MSRNNLVAFAIFAAGVALIAVYYYSTLPDPAPEAVMQETAPEQAEIEETAIAPTGGDAPGPYLAIEIDGEAKGTITIDLFEQSAPGHAAQIMALAREGKYDGVAFHRVIQGFMAQTGDVEFGRVGGDMRRAGTGASRRPDLVAEFSDIPFERGIVGMARAGDPNCAGAPNCVERPQFLNSANSQFFIMFKPGSLLNGKYTAVGKVTGGLEVLDAIKLGTGQNGAVIGAPDVMVKVTVTE